jgi:hypothetical protein
MKGIVGKPGMSDRPSRMNDPNRKGAAEARICEPIS